MSAAALSYSPHDAIVVNLDGTLIQTDTLAASAFEAIRKRPFRVIQFLVAWLRGTASCRRLLAVAAHLNIETLPYNWQLIQYLKRERAAGRRIILATGADLLIAEGVAAHLGFFEEVIAGNGKHDLTSQEMLRAILQKTGNAPFVYAGSGRSDLRLWLGSTAAILVHSPRSCIRRLRTAGITVEREFERDNSGLMPLVRCLRPHQWSKNVLVFVPLLLAHRLSDGRALGQAFVAFLAISCCASALYIVNDLLDLEADRLHPRKRKRPLAAGDVSLAMGASLSIFMAAIAAGLSTLLVPRSAIILAIYGVASLTYSLKLKRILFLDVVTLSLLYAVRVLYGGAATDVKISVWTLAFSLFFFVSLATVKRLGELRRVDASAIDKHAYRGYKSIDVTQLSSLASAAGYVAVLVLALYIDSPEVRLLYGHAQGLWLLCPIFIYWLSRLTLLANRGDLDDDPVTFALKDRATWMTGVLAVTILALST